MSNSSSEADSAPSDGIENNRDEVASKWVVRLFLILAFGLAFGIEGMTLIRSYLFDGEEETEQVESEERESEEREGPALRIGADLLPTTSASERVSEMQIQARSDGPWVFRLVVTVINDGGSPHRLSLRELEADDGTVFDEVQTIECPPGDSTRLVASWPVGKNARPQSLTAEAELQVSEDSMRSARRRVTFGHVPVQMQR